MEIQVRFEDDALAALDAAIAAEGDHATRPEMIHRIVMRRLIAGGHLPDGDAAKGREDDASSDQLGTPADEGRAAFETYGDSAHEINPHEPQTADRAEWDAGFHKAQGGPRRLR